MFINNNLLVYFERICSKYLRHKTKHGSMLSPKCACFFLRVHNKHLVKNKQEKRTSPSPNRKETSKLIKKQMVENCVLCKPSQLQTILIGTYCDHCCLHISSHIGFFLSALTGVMCFPLHQFVCPSEWFLASVLLRPV